VKFDCSVSFLTTLLAICLYSLLTLSKVLMSLGQKNPGHVNYRDSKLTRILKPSLSGNARMAVICCISPSANYVDETRSTLQFATRAKLVKTSAVKNTVALSDADIIAKLRLEIESLKIANQNLETQVLEQHYASNLLPIERSVNSGDERKRKELNNLTRFMFDDSQRRDEQRVSSHSKFFTDHDITFNNTPNHIGTIAAKDDLCQPISEKTEDLLRIALKHKAKQVKELQAELVVSKSRVKDLEKQLANVVESEVQDNIIRFESLRTDDCNAEAHVCEAQSSEIILKMNKTKHEIPTGSRVAKYFGNLNEVHLGTFTGFNGKYYHVDYDDGDSEDFTIEGLKKALALFKNTTSSDTQIGSRIIVNRRNNRLYEGTILQCRDKDGTNQVFLMLMG
jgi:hypothetical protein